MAHVHFTLPQKWIDPKNPEHVMRVAEKIQEIRYGKDHRPCPPEIQKDSSVHFPLTNDYWLTPPTVDRGQGKDHWQLVARYDSREKLEEIVKALQLCL